MADEKKKVFTSQIFIGGTVKKCSQTDSAWVLVDVGEVSKFIFCSPAKDDNALSVRLRKYDKGDHILLKGYLRLSSSKNDDGTYTNRSQVVITEISSEDPKHEQSRAAAADQFSDDDLPF